MPGEIPLTSKTTTVEFEHSKSVPSGQIKKSTEAVLSSCVRFD